MTIALLSHVPLDAGYPERFAAAGFTLHFATTPGQRATLSCELAQQIQAVLTIGSIGLSDAEMAAIAAADKNCRLIKGQVFLWQGAHSWEDLWDLDGTITGSGRNQG